MDKNDLFKTINGYDIVLEMMAGSHLYGTDTPESDKDFVGIVLPKASEFFGFGGLKELDVSIESKLNNGKDSKDAVDRKFYEFRRFVKLAVDNNPNILGMLFVRSDNLCLRSYISDELLSKSQLFIDHDKLYTKYIGLANRQMYLMSGKPENYDALIVALDFLL